MMNMDQFGNHGAGTSSNGGGMNTRNMMRGLKLLWCLKALYFSILLKMLLDPFVLYKILLQKYFSKVYNCLYPKHLF